MRPYFVKTALLAVGIALIHSSLSPAASAQVRRFDNRDYFHRYNSQDSLRTAKEIQEENNALLRSLERPITNSTPNRAGEIDLTVARQIYRGVKNHPVASLDHIYKYDPEGGIGFCFGRAMTVHLEALYRGVSNSAIKKLWALGSLASGETSWRYHVTTLIKGPDTTWYAIDPIFPGVMTAEQWYQRMKGDFDHVNGKMKLYVTDASKFGPAGGKYHPMGLDDAIYNDYFDDLMKSYKENGHKPFSGPVLIEQGSSRQRKNRNTTRRR
jgi:hypothetical protein